MGGWLKKIKGIKNVGDRVLWIVVILMSCVSLVSVYSTVGYTAIARMHLAPESMFFKHLIMVFGAYVLAFLIMSVPDYKKLAYFSPHLYAIAVVLLLYVIAVGGNRWINFLGFSFQPSELAKVCLSMMLAWLVAMYKNSMEPRTLFRWMLAAVFLIVLLIIKENLSTAAIIFFACYLMIGYAEVDKPTWKKYSLILIAVGLVFLLIVIFFGEQITFGRSTTWSHRITNWLNPNPDELSQENMARMAIARGGWLGQGIGSTIHGRLMTQAHNDFIFAIIIEESGFVTGVFIFLLYSLFFYRCIRIATHCGNVYGRVMVAGLGTIYFTQAVVNMAVATGVIPVTGQTLPFISFGGSSYLILGCALGLIQNVARENDADNRKARLAKEQAAQAEAEAAAAVQDETEESITTQNETT